MRLPRFGLRTLMVAVATTAHIALAVRLMILSVAYHRIADAHDWSVTRYLMNGPRERARWLPPPSDHDKWARAMAKKYRIAARYPWLPVAPDPPEPK